MSSNPLSESQLFFHTPSHNAASNYLYPICLGHFICDKGYYISRNSYPSFLLLVTLKGEGQVHTKEETFSLRRGEVALIDCYQPHQYGTGGTGNWSFLWVHLDGAPARAIFEEIVNYSGCHLTLSPEIRNEVITPLRIMLERLSAKESCPEILMNKYLTDILTQLSLSAQKCGELGATALEKAAAYIRQNYINPITIQDTAMFVSMSPYYFIREFKKFSGMTPHQYLLSIRMNSARFYLSTTNKTVKEIGFSCGFQSENSFCIAFKKQMGLTPLEYRKSSEL